MKIARVTLFYERQTGISRGVAEVVERLAEEHEVHVFASSWDEAAGGRIFFHKVPAWSNRYSLRKSCFFVASGIMLRRYKFDIVHLHHPSLYQCDVVTCHGLARAGMHAMRTAAKDSRMKGDHRKNRLYRSMLPLLEYNYKAGRRKKIIAISQSVKKDLVRFCAVPNEDIIVIHNGVNLDEFHPAHKLIYRGPTRDRFDLEESDFVFLFVGHFFRRKGFNTVLKALSRLRSKNVKLLVVGKHSAERDSFMRLTQDMGLNSRVIFVGRTDHVNHYYAASDAFIFPTFYEPFGLAILEAMACGLPVITSKLAGAAELITDSVNGMLLNDPTNESQLIRKMELLISNPELRMTLGKAARSSAEKCSWDTVADKTEQLYAESLMVK